MYNQKTIFTMILVIVVVCLFPFIKSAGRAAETPQPDLNTPVIQQLADKKCIEDTEFMRKNHMKLVNQWRVLQVRSGQETYTATNGKEYPMSLTENCLSCHSNKEEFCDSCHTYSEVAPDCWECHVGGNNNGNG